MIRADNNRIQMHRLEIVFAFVSIRQNREIQTAYFR